ncbi:MAG: shikimate dehydrogenase, partial [Muribaculaceae bacterium]|nr:shikimate dehydrogenase [Muribaculaceae bacterium]
MKLYGLTGWPLGHSFSATYFNTRFSRDKTEAEYKLYPIEDISKILDIVDIETNLVGFNVTAPYKQKVIPFLSSITDEAKRVNAVNTVKIERLSHKDKHPFLLYGHNTDIAGFRESVRPLLRADIN